MGGGMEVEEALLDLLAACWRGDAATCLAADFYSLLKYPVFWFLSVSLSFSLFLTELS